MFPSAASRTRAQRRNTRGAAMVEALIVVSILVLGFMGLVFFKQMYVGQLHAQRVARASIIAHGMGACEANYAPDWAGEDVGNSAANQGLPSEEAADGAAASQVSDGAASGPSTSTTPPNTGADSRAAPVVNGLEQTTPDGNGFLNKIAGNEFTSKVEVNTNQGTARESRFRADVRSTAFVSCGDPVIRETGFGDAFSRVASIMGDFLNPF